MFLIVFLAIFFMTTAVAIISLVLAYLLGRWYENVVVRERPTPDV